MPVTGYRTVDIFPPRRWVPVTFERMSGGEALGAPFEFDVDVLSPTGDIPIGKGPRQIVHDRDVAGRVATALL